MESIKKELTWWQAPGSRQWGANQSIVMNNPSINKSTTTGFCIFWALGVNGHFWALGVNGHFWALGVNGHFWALGVNGHFGALGAIGLGPFRLFLGWVYEGPKPWPWPNTCQY